MIRINELKGMMARKGLSGRAVAKELGITEKTFYSKMKKGIFTSSEMNALIKILEIQDPAAVFFAPDVT